MDIWVRLAILVASYFISKEMAPKVEQPKPPSLEDIDFPTIEEGTPKAVIFGDCWQDSFQILGVGNYRTYAIKIPGGKK